VIQARHPRTDGIIGIIGATVFELEFLRRRIDIIEEGRAETGRYFRGNFAGKELVLMASGIGYNHAARACTHLIDRFSPSAILSLGLAGSVDLTTTVGDILLVTHFLRVVDMEKLGVEEIYKVDEKIIDILSKTLDKNGFKFKIGGMLTVPHFVFKLEERCRIGRHIEVKAVEMEGAAVASEARKHGIPLVALRLISDDMSSREINYGMLIGPTGKPTLKGGIRLSLVHGRDIVEVFRFGREVRRLGTILSGIGARVVQEIFRERDVFSITMGCNWEDQGGGN
jgi:adenosylhomocysteine nucleosidase